MSQKSGYLNSNSHLTVDLPYFPKKQSLLLPCTPIKKRNDCQINFYSSLSPLPLPPKMDENLISSFCSFSNELCIVETPFRKQHPKFLVMFEDDGIHDGISSRIIFESQGQNHQNQLSRTQNDGEQKLNLVKTSLSLEQNKEAQPFQIPEAMPQKEDHKRTRQEGQQFQNNSKRTSDIFSHENINKKISCNCKKTKCLKLYCDCFKLNRTCEGCNCLDCHNIQAYNDQRIRSIQCLKKKHSLSTSPTIQNKQMVKSCNCKKSGCKKGYCECYHANLKCGEHCKCQECQNIYSEKEFQSQQQADANISYTIKKEKMIVEI